MSVTTNDKLRSRFNTSSFFESHKHSLEFQKYAFNSWISMEYQIFEMNHSSRNSLAVFVTIPTYSLCQACTFSQDVKNTDAVMICYGNNDCKKVCNQTLYQAHQ